MTTRYRLPDDLGGHPVTVLHGMASTDGRVDFYVDLDGGTFAMTLPLAALIEVEPALPPEPPLWATVVVGEHQIFQHQPRGSFSGYSVPGHPEDYTWAEVCSGGTPVLLVPAPEPVALPWELRSGHRYIHVRADPGLEEDDRLPGSAFVEVRDDDGNAAAEIWLTSNARRRLIAALSAADAAEARP